MVTFRKLSQDWTEEQYREYPAYHYSMLSDFQRGGFEVLDKLNEPKSSPSLTFGSMVDTLITEGEESFYNKFYVSKVKEPSDVIKDICNALFELFDSVSSFNDVPDDSILVQANIIGYQPKYQPDTKVKKVREYGSDYFNNLLASKGKTIVCQEDVDDAFRCYDTLKTNPLTSGIFSGESSGDIEIMYQPKFITEINGHPYKCMIDALVVNHIDKTIQLYDLKTSSSPEYRFYKSYIKWNYWIQSESYTMAISNLISGTEFAEYAVLPFKFIVINRVNLSPEIWSTENFPPFSAAFEDYKKLGITDWQEDLNNLDYYISNNSLTPKGINEENNLWEWIKKDLL